MTTIGIAIPVHLCLGALVLYCRVECVDRITAYKTCGAKKLMNHNDLQGLQEQASSLTEGESAWIAGYVEYSPYIVYDGCRKRKKSLAAQISNTDNLLHACSKYCYDEKEITFYHFATHQTYCHCITSAEREELVKPDIPVCEIDMVEMIKPDYINNEDNYLLYTIKKNYEMELPRQCIYIKWQPSKTIDVRSSSCFTLSSTPMHVKGYICAAGTTALTGCVSVNKCIFNIAAIWVDALKSCFNHSGILIESVDDSRINAIRGLRVNYSYWTGLFRSYRIIDEGSVSDHKICLAVTKVNGQLLFDPDSCSADKRTICSQNSTDSPQTKTTLIHVSSPPSTKIDPTVTRTPETDNSVPVYVFITGTIILVLAITIICFVVVRKRRRAQGGNKRLLLKSNSEFSGDGYPAPESHYAEPSDICIENNGEQPRPIETKPTLQQKPSKPIRRTLKRQKAVIDYENFELGTKKGQQKDKSNNRSRNGKNEYDKISFKAKPNVIHAAEDADIHVYNHTNANVNGGDYDTMKSVKSTHSQGTPNSTYNRVVSIDKTATSQAESNTTAGDQKFAFCVLEDEDDVGNEYTDINKSEAKNLNSDRALADDDYVDVSGCEIDQDNEDIDKYIDEETDNDNADKQVTRGDNDNNEIRDAVTDEYSSVMIL